MRMAQRICLCPPEGAVHTPLQMYSFRQLPAWCSGSLTALQQVVPGCAQLQTVLATCWMQQAVLSLDQ